MNLSMPADHWCPVCLIHNRSQDGFNEAAHILKDECPVCADMRRTGELPPLLSPGAVLVRQRWDALQAAARDVVGPDLRGLRL